MKDDVNGTVFEVFRDYLSVESLLPAGAGTNVRLESPTTGSTDELNNQFEFSFVVAYDVVEDGSVFLPES